MLLSGKHVVITGAGGGLGRAVVRVARAQGASLILVDALEIAGAPGDQILRVDLVDPVATIQALGGLAIDAVFHLAGGFAMGPLSHETSADEWAAMLKTNVDTLRHVAAAVVPGMIARGRGKLVTVGAMSGQRGQPQMGAYSAAKSAVMRLTESMAAELKTKGINVNGVLPSIIDTPKNRADMPGADSAAWVSPEDLANVICFLGSDAARAIHGVLIPVTGLL